jgi:hypothetical protein
MRVLFGIAVDAPSLSHAAPDLVAADIATLKERHGARCISFMANACRRGCRGAREDSPPLEISWRCEVRFERA